MKPPMTGTFQVELAGPICQTCNVDTRLLITQYIITVKNQQYVLKIYFLFMCICV